MSHHRNQLRSEARKAAYRDTKTDNYNPGQFTDPRQKNWYEEKYSYILNARKSWRNTKTN